MNQQRYIDNLTPFSSAASARGRKRKHAPSASTPSRAHSFTQHLPHPYPAYAPPHRYPHQGGQPAPHGYHPGAGAPGMMPGHGQGSLGLNVLSNLPEELPENVLDDLDRLTPRDLATARYIKNHELLSMIFDARRIDTMQSAPSPYSSMSVPELTSRVSSLQSELRQLSDQHTRKLQRLNLVISGKLPANSPVWDEAGDGVLADDSEQQQQATEDDGWAKHPSRGRIVGLGFVRAETPPELRARSQAATGQTERQPASESNNMAVDGQDATAEAEAERQRQELEAIQQLNQAHGIVQPSATPTPAPGSVPPPVPAPVAAQPTPPPPTPGAPVLAPAQLLATAEPAQAEADTAKPQAMTVPEEVQADASACVPTGPTETAPEAAQQPSAETTSAEAATASASAEAAAPEAPTATDGEANEEDVTMSDAVPQPTEAAAPTTAEPSSVTTTEDSNVAKDETKVEKTDEDAPLPAAAVAPEEMTTETEKEVAGQTEDEKGGEASAKEVSNIA